MTDTPDPEGFSALASVSSQFRNALIQRGFSDDGVCLRGPVLWHDAHGAVRSSRVEIHPNSRFPFAPPDIKLLEAEPDVTPTFHIERNENLCLWTSDIPVDNAPWRDPDQLLEKISSWIEQTAAGWPDDDDADLERYLERNDTCIVVYDDSLLEQRSVYRTSRNPIGVVTVTEPLGWSANPERMKNKGVRRKERNLLAVIDVGLISHPIRTWQDLQDASGSDCETLRKLIHIGSVHYVLVRYQRGTRRAALVLDFPTTHEGVPALRICESADQSMATRTLRAGPAAPNYDDTKVAVIGCGAIGSHIADLLFRSGVYQLTLLDFEKLRPGNIIRHTADNAFIGAWKPDAVKAQLRITGLPVDRVRTEIARVDDPSQAVELARSHDFIVDATAEARATSLLRWATEQTGKSLVSVCVQRDGGIARVDRFPLRPGERHLDAVPWADREIGIRYEQGCGSPVSMTPPLAVVMAASIGCQVVLDEIGGTALLPATILEVVEPQPDQPYDAVGTLRS